MSDIDIIKEENETRGRYVAVVDGQEAELTFTKVGAGAVIADHTGVPSELGGRGIAKALVNALIADARASGFKIIPLCPYVKAQFDRNPDWADVLQPR